MSDYMEGYKERYDNPRYEWYDKSLYFHFKDYLPEDKKAKILDVGCGMDRTLHMLRVQSYQNLKGVDMSEQMAKYCKNQGFDVDCLDIWSFLGKDPETYDLIILREVLEHLPKKSVIPLLHILRDKLNKKGKLLIVVLNCENPLVTGHNRYSDFTHEWGPTPDSLKYIFRMAGFESHSIKGMTYYTEGLKGKIGQKMANILFAIIKKLMALSGQGGRHILNYKLIGVGQNK